MLSSAARFADDAAGLEKTLRLVQGFSTAIAGLNVTQEVAAPWQQARSQLALGRRYFRLLKWYSCWEMAHNALHSAEEDTFAKMLAVCNWTFLGLYYFIEMPTITNAMGVTAYSWGPMLQYEADKCWFYAITFSIILSLYRMLYLFGATTASTKPSDDKSTVEQDMKSKEPPTQSTANGVTYAPLLARLAIDCCDLTIPGSSTGWIPVQLAVVGAAQFTSSAIAGLQIWRRVQQEE